MSPEGTAAGRQDAWPEGHWDWPVPLPYRHGVTAACRSGVGG